MADIYDSAHNRRTVEEGSKAAVQRKMMDFHARILPKRISPSFPIGKLQQKENVVPLGKTKTMREQGSFGQISPSTVSCWRPCPQFPRVYARQYLSHGRADTASKQSALAAPGLGSYSRKRFR